MPCSSRASGKCGCGRRRVSRRCLPATPTAAALSARLAGALEFEPDRVDQQLLGARAWEREWLRDFHALRFGSRLWICPRHEQVTERGAVVVTLDPGLAFGTGTHPSTALCLEWLDAKVTPAMTPRGLRVGLRDLRDRRGAARRRTRGRLRHRPASAARDRGERRRERRRRANLACTRRPPRCRARTRRWWRTFWPAPCANWPRALRDWSVPAASYCWPGSSPTRQKSWRTLTLRGLISPPGGNGKAGWLSRAARMSDVHGLS